MHSSSDVTKTPCSKQHVQSLRVDERRGSEWRATLASNVCSSLANVCTPRCFSLSDNQYISPSASTISTYANTRA